MKRSSTTFLKISIFLIGLPIFVLCILGLPWLINNPVNPYYSIILYPIIFGLYLTVVPFFIALYQAIQLLNFIDRNKSFSDLSIQSLKVIKFCAFTISGLYALMMPLFYLLAEVDDAPGIILIGIVFVFASLVGALFAAVLQKLLKEAIDIKTDNDLTI